MHHRSSRSRGSSTKEKIRRDNVGKVPLPAEVTATCKDSLPRKIHRQWEGLGLAHEPVSDERGATPSDVAWNAMALKVTPHIPGIQKILWWIYQKDQELIPKACQNSGNRRFCTESRRQIFQNRMDPQIYFFQRNPPCPAQCTIKSGKVAL